MANKQFLIPGYGVIDQKDQDEQWLVPGYGVIDEKGAPVSSGFHPAWAVNSTHIGGVAIA